MKRTILNNTTDDEQIKKLHLLVEDAIREEALIIEQLSHPAKSVLSRSDILADRMALFGGSWKFIILFIAVLSVWIIYNMIRGTEAFDPYPFILMNLLLSAIAALQAPIIMMSQNRQEVKDRQHAENDYLINLKAEMEIRNINQKINLLMEEQIKRLLEAQSVEIALIEQLHKKIENIRKRYAGL